MDFEQDLAETWYLLSGKRRGAKAWCARLMGVRSETISRWCKEGVAPEPPLYARRLLGIARSVVRLRDEAHKALEERERVIAQWRDV